VAYRGGIHPIVVTLAGIYVYRGLMLRFTGGYEVMNLPAEFRVLAEGTLAGIPKVVWFAAAVHAINAWFLNRTLLGAASTRWVDRKRRRRWRDSSRGWCAPWRLPWRARSSV